MCIVVANQLPQKEGESEIRYINGNGTKPYNIYTLQRRFLSILYSFVPDIVHLHGAWSFITSKVHKWCLDRDFLTVYSPHGQLNGNVINTRFWSKLPRILLYQKQMVKCTNAIMADDAREREQLKKLGWNRKIDIVSSETETDSGSKTYSELYQKVIDSNTLHFIGINEFEAFSSLLRSGISVGGRRGQLSGEAILNLRNITPTAYQRISLLASDLLCLDIIERGVQNNQLTLKMVDTDAIERYPLKRSRSSAPLSDSELIQGNKYIYNILNNRIKSSEETIRELCIQIINTKYLVNDGSISVSHLSTLYEKMRTSDIDEIRFADLLKALGIQQFTRRIIQILHEFFLLEWGYMPLAPLNDFGTESIRKVIMTIKR